MKMFLRGPAGYQGCPRAKEQNEKKLMSCHTTSLARPTRALQSLFKTRICHIIIQITYICTTVVTRRGVKTKKPPQHCPKSLPGRIGNGRIVTYQYLLLLISSECCVYRQFHCFASCW